MLMINSNRGIVKIEELKEGFAARFAAIYGIDLVQQGSHLTFSPLQNIKRYSIKGLDYIGAKASVTFEGEPSEVLEANDLFYSMSLGKAVAVSGRSYILSKQGFYYVNTSLIEAGSLIQTGQRVTGYRAFWTGSFFRYGSIDLE